MSANTIFRIYLLRTYSKRSTFRSQSAKISCPRIGIFDIADIVRNIDEVMENTFKYMNILNNNFKKCLKLNTVNISDFLDLY